MLKNKQWICNLIALIILITGMCVDEVRADSVFICPQTAKLTSVDTVGEVFTEVTLEPTELLCTRNTTTGSQIIAQITNGRRTIRLSMVFLCVTVFLLLLSNFYATERIAEFPRLSVQTAVLTYIHNTDGKK